MWTWDQSAGTISHDGQLVGHGYSGADWGKNNPEAQAAPSLGPIPAGLWSITGVYNSDKVGPYALILEPKDGTETFGRSAFRCHGDSISHPGQASHGCIILPRNIRQQIWTSGDHDLEVTA
jgi:hypothetical protein